MEIVLAAAIPMQAADAYVYIPKVADHSHKPSQVPSALRGGILPGVTTIDFAEAIRRRLAERGQSQYRAALNSGLPQDAIRSVLNGPRPAPEPRRADLPRPRPGALHRSVAGCSGRGRRRGNVPPADALQLERPTAGAGDFAAVAGGLPDGERRAGSDAAGAGGPGRPAGVLRVVSRLLDGPERHRAGGLSASSLRARSSNPASGSGSGTGRGAKGCGG